MDIITEIATEEKAWQEYNEINENKIKEILLDVINLHQNLHIAKEFELSILLTNDDKMQSLNYEFRKQNKATNVLSFPDENIMPSEVKTYKPQGSQMYLGDIAFGFNIIAQEAKERNISFYNHFIHLLIHGILHLIGYDHMTPEDANNMEYVEISLLQKYNISSPY